eukprot:6443886-Pyramimonas_sp.AAC.1
MSPHSRRRPAGLMSPHSRPAYRARASKKRRRRRKGQAKQLAADAADYPAASTPKARGALHAFHDASELGSVQPVRVHCATLAPK